MQHVYIYIHYNDTALWKWFVIHSRRDAASATNSQCFRTPMFSPAIGSSLYIHDDLAWLSGPNGPIATVAVSVGERSTRGETNGAPRSV